MELVWNAEEENGMKPVEEDVTGSTSGLSLAWGLWCVRVPTRLVAEVVRWRRYKVVTADI